MRNIVTFSQKACITQVSNFRLWKRQSVIQNMHHHHHHHHHHHRHHRHHHHYPLLTTPVNVWQKLLPSADKVTF
jgi:hypothetical protein